MYNSHIYIGWIKHNNRFKYICYITSPKLIWNSALAHLLKTLYLKLQTKLFIFQLKTFKDIHKNDWETQITYNAIDMIGFCMCSEKKSQIKLNFVLRIYIYEIRRKTKEWLGHLKCSKEVWCGCWGEFIFGQNISFGNWD